MRSRSLPLSSALQAFNYADRAGAERIAFVAPDEWSKGLVRIKDRAFGVHLWPVGPVIPELTYRFRQDLRNFKATDPDDLKQKDVPIDVWL